MKQNYTITMGTWDIMSNFGTNSTEIICWHMLDLKLKGETDGIFFKELKTPVGDMKVIALLIECELIEWVICMPDEFDEHMEELTEFRRKRLEWKAKCKLEREQNPDKYISDILDGI